MSKGSAIIGMLVCLVGGFALGNMMAKPSSDGEIAAVGDESGPAPAAAGDVERFKVPVTAQQPVKGAPDALVTIVEVSDFQCPFCSRVQPTIKQIEQTYGKDVRFVWRNNPLPFHQKAPLAHQAALEAFAQGGSPKFWKMHDMIFEHQDAIERADLEKYAQQLGLNMDKFKRALDTNAHQTEIGADQQLAASLGARGTPAFFINGRQLMGAQPIDAFKQVIDDEIKRAKTLVSSGTARGRVYAELTRGALTKAAEPEPAAAQPQARPDPNAVYKVPIDGLPQKGARDALITVVEVSDFECPFCSRVQPTLKQIEEKYGRDVRVAWMNNPLPFHQHARLAHNAAMEAFDQGGNDKFWQMHDIIFQNQQAITREDLEKYATQLKLNMPRFKQALDTNKYNAAIDQQQQLAGSLGARGTPAFFINGRNLAGAQPFESFQRVIDEELTKAKDKVAKGTPRARVYEETIKDGATAVKMVGAAAPQAPEAEPDADKVYTIQIPADAPRKGARNPKVVIQAFSDFQCPFCSRVLPTLKMIETEYGDKVQVVWRNYPLPFHDKAMLAHEASMEVNRQGGSVKFWKMHDTLFQNQQALERADLEKYAEQVGGINMQEFKQALDSHRHQARIQADIKAIEDAGARIGTPSFFIQGRLLQGAQPVEAFKAAIDRALKS